tara:strand:- start:19725 stop:22130 length:2406 start_codon:yes stop_codon:yes gene_type:complete
MRNNFLIFLTIFFLNSILKAENLLIESKRISLDKKTELSIFEDDVIITTSENNIIKSDYAEYDKKKGVIVLKKNVHAIDDKQNEIKSNHAIYNENLKILKSIGSTKISTSENYILEGNDITFDNLNGFIISDNEAKITDQDNNKIYLSNFKYLINNYIFKSVGKIKIEDNFDNTYNFSQIYIDTKKKELLGTDIKTFINNNDFKINKENKPRIFANTIKMDKEITEFGKSNFTLCNYRENDKCPPWSIQATKMLHDNKKKTIYYDNALIKIYDIPVFYTPRLSHPDPTVKRRSGFLVPSFEDTNNLGEGVSIPYYWAINKDRDLTLTNKLYVSENPLFLGEYRQDLKNSNLIFDFGYTEGYKKTSSNKVSGKKNHFFSKFVKNFYNTYNNSESTLLITTQDSNNDKYFKLYKINSELISNEIETLENSIDFTHSNDEIFFGFNASMYETLKSGYNDKYEYVYPELSLSKNLLSDSTYGSLNFDTNLKVRTYDTNKTSKFLINNFDWELSEKIFNTGIQTKFLSNLRNINYETKNINEFKSDTTNEVFGALGILSKIDLYKKVQNISEHFLTPKIFVRYAPGSMRKEQDDSKLTPSKAFNINRLNDNNNFETGLSASLGFDYEIKKENKKIDISIGQIFNQNENKNMPTTMGLDEKVSDLVGVSKYKINDKFNLNYNFAIDQNYNEFNYNEIGLETNFSSLNFDVNYLQEKKHIGNNEYIKSKIDYNIGKDTNLSYEFKRNLITNSSEFYNLSYEYINDCLKAGLVFRREFYNDSEIESENSLMFKITLIPFGNVNSPKLNK